mmetsp:Transcript_11205/g.33952  ORF Transcript_11205/g.33952 Transcript_11205/m.33952 type:complete len:247 (+) Transcript_11205:66-806(+)
MTSSIGSSPPTVCVLGATGVGKGATLNACFGTDRFGTSFGAASHTIRPQLLELPWRGRGPLLRGVDLCGFSDSEGRDSDFLGEMVRCLKEEVGQVHCFLLLLNSQEARVGRHIKDMLLALRSVFGDGLLRHVLLGFTRWDYSRRGRLLRERGYAASEEALRAGVNAELRKAVGHGHDCDAVFLDNTQHMCSPSELEEMYPCADERAAVKAAFDAALDTVLAAATASLPFSTRGIEPAIAQRDAETR